MEKEINVPNALVHWEDKVIWYVNKKCLYSTPGGLTQKINFLRSKPFFSVLRFLYCQHSWQRGVTQLIIRRKFIESANKIEHIWTDYV